MPVFSAAAAWRLLYVYMATALHSIAVARCKASSDRNIGSNRDLLDTLTTYAHLASALIGASPDTARGFHPFGAADPSGFAAMACDELLIHTDAAARGLGLVFRPPDELARVVLRSKI
jgi:hypothetical protein